MFSITYNFCSSCRIKKGPTPLYHPSLQERKPQDENVGIRLLRSKSPFVFYHCQCGVSPVVVVGRNSFLVLVWPYQRFVLQSNALFRCLSNQADTSILETTLFSLVDNDQIETRRTISIDDLLFMSDTNIVSIDNTFRLEKSIQTTSRTNNDML